MRFATFRVNGTGDESAEVSVVALRADAAEVLPNVNRWRGQLGLPAVTEKDLPTLVSVIQVDGQGAVLFDFVGHAGDDPAATRMLAVMAPHADRTWFFKMTGPDALVAVAEKAFEDFVCSFHFHDCS